VRSHRRGHLRIRRAGGGAHARTNSTSPRVPQVCLIRGVVHRTFFAAKPNRDSYPVRVPDQHLIEFDGLAELILDPLRTAGR
jgi:hypothetical protein